VDRPQSPPDARDHDTPRAGRFPGHERFANDYEFLEHTLKAGKLLDYYRRWDYAIDAFPLGPGSSLSAALSGRMLGEAA
jgi:hypothetical protein